MIAVRPDGSHRATNTCVPDHVDCAEGFHVVSDGTSCAPDTHTTCEDGYHVGYYWADHQRNVRQLNYQQGERGDDRGDDPPSDLDLRVVV